MRNRIVVLGFFIFILILIAGCTSAQNGASTVSKSQNLPHGDSNVKTTNALSQIAPTECNLPSVDPIRFQKFFPNIPGWTREFGQNISVGNNYFRDSKNNDNQISEIYLISDKYLINGVVISFADKGPCVTKSTGVNAFLNSFPIGTEDHITYSRIYNFHGYPGIKQIDSGSVIVTIGINNRLYVYISTIGPNDEYPISDKNKDIEKFANAINFKGFASSVE